MDKRRDSVRKTLDADGRTFRLGDYVKGEYLRRSTKRDIRSPVSGVVQRFEETHALVGVHVAGYVNLKWCRPEDLSILESTDASAKSVEG